MLLAFLQQGEEDLLLNVRQSHATIGALRLFAA